MSSAYRLLCLSHDPALAFSVDLMLVDVDAITHRDDSVLDVHHGCDVVAGRFSYPLVEVACLGRRLLPQGGCKGLHANPAWVDSDWLRLLLAAAPHVDDAVLFPFVTRCWPLDRLSRLRVQLGVGE